MTPPPAAPATSIDDVLRDGTVRSVFQPIVELDTGRVVAYEALARGPQGPLERPDQLFAAAREAGRLAELDAACRNAALTGALAAGAGFGLFFVLLDRTREDAELSPLVAARVVSVLVVVVLARLVSRSLSVPRGVLPVVLLTGVADMTANALFLLAAQQGQLAITGVLASLYPVSTVVLAQLVLRERLAATQAVGLAAAGVAVVLIALPS